MVTSLTAEDTPSTRKHSSIFGRLRKLPARDDFGIFIVLRDDTGPKGSVHCSMCASRELRSKVNGCIGVWDLSWVKRFNAYGLAAEYNFDSGSFDYWQAEEHRDGFLISKTLTDTFAP